MRILLLGLQLALLALASAESPPAGTPTRAPILHERDLLLAFSKAVTNWAEVMAAWELQGWTECRPGSCLPVCSWSNIECDPYGTGAGGMQVSALHFGCSGCGVPLRGRLAPQLGQLQALQQLHLAGNELGGQLPAEWGEPGAFPCLLELDLSSNNVAGSVPDQWTAGATFLKLTVLQLSGNLLGGPFPPGLAAATTAFASLQALYLSDNQLSGPLPRSLTLFRSLTLLALQNNAFTGPLPETWAAPNATGPLQQLALHGNQLAGGLPAGWAAPGAFPSLQQLTLSDNPQLGGALPAAWGSLSGAWPSLLELNASGCGLAGSLPDWSAGLQSLMHLSLAGNELAGSVPASWAQLPQLQRVDMQPGNPGMCTALPEGSRFRLCQAGGVLCTAPEPSNASQCEAPTPSPAGSSGFPTAAVAAVSAAAAVVVVLAAAAAGVWWRRKRRARVAEAAGKLELVPDSGETGGSCVQEGEGCGEHPGNPELEAQAGGGHDVGGAVAIAVAAPQHVQQAQCTSPWELARQQRQPQEQPQPQPQKESGFGGGGACTPPPPSQPGLEPTGSEVVHAEAMHALLSQRSSMFVSPHPGTCHSGSEAGGQGGEEGALAGGPLPSLDVIPSLDVVPSFPLRELAALQLSDWEIDATEIQVMKRPDGTDWQLGSGGFGTVFKALRNGVQPVAVKVLGSASNADVGKAMLDNTSFAAEISILRACRDTNILQFQGVCFKDDRTLLITEYCEGGNLAHNLRAKRVSWWRRGKKIALDVARALVYLHARKIVHLDIKSANVLLTRDGTAKVGDVGMAKVMAHGYVTGVLGTLAWSAPEMLWGKRCTAKADIYSFGVVLWEICTGELPVRGQLRDPIVPEECPSVVVDIMYRCLSAEPEARPTASELVELLGGAPAVQPHGSGVPTPPGTLSPFGSRGTVGGAGSSKGSSYSLDASRRPSVEVLRPSVDSVRHSWDAHGHLELGLASPTATAVLPAASRAASAAAAPHFTRPLQATPPPLRLPVPPLPLLHPPPALLARAASAPYPGCIPSLRQAQQAQQQQVLDDRLVREAVADMEAGAPQPPPQRRPIVRYHAVPPPGMAQLEPAGSLTATSPFRQDDVQQQQASPPPQLSPAASSLPPRPGQARSARLSPAGSGQLPQQQQQAQRQAAQLSPAGSGQPPLQRAPAAQLSPAGSLTAASPFRQVQ